MYTSTSEDSLYVSPEFAYGEHSEHLPLYRISVHCPTHNACHFYFLYCEVIADKAYCRAKVALTPIRLQ